MNEQDRQAIDGLFAKLGEAERQSGPRDAEAEGFIAQRVAQQPAAPYLMAQTIVMQGYALEQAQARISELEQQAQQAQEEERPASGGGLFGSLFGASQPPRRSTVPSMPRPGSPFGAAAAQQGYGQQQGAPGGYPPPGYQQGQGGFQQGGMQQGMPGRPGFGGGFGGGGFLAGAAQTAMGVAGGVLLGNAIAGMFGGDEAKAAEAPADPAQQPGPDTQASNASATDTSASDPGADDISGADNGGWFDGGGWFGGDEEI